MPLSRLFRRRRPTALLPLLLVVAAAGAGACAGADGGSTGGTTTPTTPPTPAKVATVEVTPRTASLIVGGTQAMSAALRDAAGNTLTGRTVSWSSSATTVASIDGNGGVTAVAPGSATITATAEGVSGSAAVTVTPVPVASVLVTPATATIRVGSTQALTATARDAAGGTLSGRTATYASGTPAVATVSTSGVVTAVAPGTAVITATIEDKSAASTITVVPVPVATVTITPATVSLLQGQTQTLSAGARDSAGNALTGRAVSWATSSAAVATVTTTGVVTAVAAGAATITATVEGKTATAAVTVTPVPIASLAVTPATVSLAVGGTQALTTSARDSAGNALTGRAVSWSTSSAAVATVSTTGVVTAVAAGAATITATVEGKTATAAVTVTPVPVASLTLSASTASVFVDSTLTLVATPRDASGAALTGRTVTWSSSASTIATVSSAGVVTGIGPGSATITATSEGKSATATVTVSYRLTFRMYSATSLTGPWTNSDVVVAGTDALQLVDPSPVLMPDGTIQLYYLMNYFREGDPASAQPNSQWKLGVATSSDDGRSFTHRGVPYTSPVAITDPFPMVLADGRVRLLYAQTTGTTSYVYSATSADATGLAFPYTPDSGARSTGASIPGALRIGSSFYLYTCDAGIMVATSSDGLTFGSRTQAIPGSPSTGIICDPSPISLSATSHVMAYKTRPPGVQNPRSDSTYLATSTNGTTWTSVGGVVGAGSVPGLVRDRNGVYRIYVVYFPPR